jgi:hypothetical protein
VCGVCVTLKFTNTVTHIVVIVASLDTFNWVFNIKLKEKFAAGFDFGFGILKPAKHSLVM